MSATFKINGGDEENRTPDPLLARQVLSQLSYAPMTSRPIFAHLTSLLVGRLGRRSSATTPGVSLQAPSHLHKSVPLEFAIPSLLERLSTSIADLLLPQN